MRISDWSSDVFSSDLRQRGRIGGVIAFEPRPLDTRHVGGARIGEPVGKTRADVAERPSLSPAFLHKPARQPVELLIAQIIARARKRLSERDEPRDPHALGLRAPPPPHGGRAPPQPNAPT